MSNQSEHYVHSTRAWVLGVIAPILFLLITNDFSLLTSYYVSVSKLWLYFPISQLVFYGVGYLLTKAQESGAKILLADLTNRERIKVGENTFWGDTAFGFVLMGGIVMPILGILVANFFIYDSFFINLVGGFVQLVYFPAFVAFHCLIIGVVTYYSTHLFAGLHYAFVPHPAAKNVAPAAEGQSQKPIDEKALADTLEDQDAPSTHVGMALRAFRADKLAKTLRAKAKMNRADAGVADATTEYERARRHLKDAKKHAEKVRGHTED